MRLVKDEEEFWQALDRLVEGSRVVVDRPKGSRHPRFPERGYPLDYGYLEGTTASDGAGVDVWVGGLRPTRVTGAVATVDLLKRDTELKLLLGCDEQEMAVIRDFLCSGPMQAVVLRRGSA